MSTANAQDRGTDTEFILPPDELEKHARDAEQFCGGLVVRGDPRMLKILEEIHLLGDSDAATLLQGESGTGKELFARLVRHVRTPGKPYVVVNMAGIEDGLIASELFGHVRGAFTNAVADRPGRFEQAKDGTIFLDEIGDMPLAKQGMLLRAVEQRTFSPVGGNKEIKHEATIVCATNRDIRVQQEIGKMREDLYHRLRACLLVIPPFRERSQEHQALVVRSLAARLGKSIGRQNLQVADDAMSLLLNFPVDGNVRGLEHIIHAAARYTEYKGKDEIGKDEMARALERAPRREGTSAAHADGEMLSSMIDYAERMGYRKTIDALGRKIAECVLDRHGGNASAAAFALRITRSTLRNVVSRGEEIAFLENDPQEALRGLADSDGIGKVGP